MKKMENRHSGWIRFFHWTNMIAICTLILSGFYIHAPQSWGWLFDNMDNARMLHFAMAYLLCFGAFGRVYYAIAADDAKNVWFDVKTDPGKFPSMIKYYTFLADDHPFYGKYNPGQKMMYSTFLFMVIIQVVTGFILYKPQVLFLSQMGDYLGGEIALRMVHYIITWIFCLFILAHVYLDMSEGMPVLKSMFTGKIPADFHHGYHEEGEEA